MWSKESAFANGTRIQEGFRLTATTTAATASPNFIGGALSRRRAPLLQPNPRCRHPRHVGFIFRFDGGGVVGGPLGRLRAAGARYTCSSGLGRRGVLGRHGDEGSRGDKPDGHAMPRRPICSILGLGHGVRGHREVRCPVPQPRQGRVRRRLHFLYQLLCGLKYLHSANILHRDLKPSNLLLNEHGVLKLCDFGLARTVTTSSPPLTPQVGTLWYKAPEILLHSTVYTSSIDVWSVGCILMEFMLGKTLFPGTHEDQQLRLIFELIGTPNKNADLSFLDKTAARDVLRHPCHARQPFIKLFPNVKDPLAIDLAEQMLVFDPRERITVDDALAHPFLATVRDPSNEVLCHKPFSFDCEHPPLSEEQVNNLIYEEALRFQPSFGNPLLKR